MLPSDWPFCEKTLREGQILTVVEAFHDASVSSGKWLLDFLYSVC